MTPRQAINFIREYAIMNEIWQHRNKEKMQEAIDVLNRLVNKIEKAKEVTEHLIEEGFEGSVLKGSHLKYEDKFATLKIKKFETVDVVVYDYEIGNGKYSNTIGALKIGYYDEEKDTFIHMSNVAPGTDEERKNWFENWNEMKNTVIEVKCQEITKRSLRHPVIVRIRNDKDYTMCTKETIFRDEE